jgi:two-component system chemotaxis response regulator CheB
MPARSIRVLLVEDSPVALAVLKRLINTAPDLQLVGTARTGREALTQISRLQPDVICTDLHMPEMDGLALTQAVMSDRPRPILVISASVQEEDTQNIFKLLEAGAVDIFPKPQTGAIADYEAIAQPLIAKIRVLAGVRVFTQRRRATPATLVATTPATPSPTTPSPATPSPARPAHSPSRPHGQSPQPRPSSTSAVQAIAIGASTGGPQALQAILGSLPAVLPAPIFAVQHISDGFLTGLVAWLNQTCPVRVEIAQPGATPQPSVVYFPPERRHLELDTQGNFRLAGRIPVSGHCPSVTVMMESIAAFYGPKAIGILLTGMGQDGATGMQALQRAGSFTIAQNEATSVVFGMPHAAIALGAAEAVLPIEAIASTICSRVLGRT